MQGLWKTKTKYIQKDKFEQIVKTIRYLNPHEFKKPLKVDFIEDYKLKQSRCPNNPVKKTYRKLASSKNRRMQRDYLKKMRWEDEITTHRISKSILWEVV